MLADEVIQAIQESPQFIHLKKVVIELPGRPAPFVPSRKILILESCGLTSARQARIDREIKASPLVLEFIDPLEQFGASRLYADMASVSFGDVPEFLDFMAMLPSDTKLWLETAMQVNPSQFAWIMEMTQAIDKADAEYFKAIGVTIEATKEEKPEDRKKKPRKPRKSASG